jgi:hypothetical protein
MDCFPLKIKLIINIKYSGIVRTGKKGGWKAGLYKSEGKRKLDVYGLTLKINGS